MCAFLKALGCPLPSVIYEQPQAALRRSGFYSLLNKGVNLLWWSYMKKELQDERHT